jgi:hypothetical protein
MARKRSFSTAPVRSDGPDSAYRTPRQNDKEKATSASTDRHLESDVGARSVLVEAPAHGEGEEPSFGTARVT